MRRMELGQGVYFTYLPSDKFKTSFLSAQFVTPLRAETASAHALIPAVLRRGTARYPDMQSLSAALDLLYGARVEYTVRKKGENQCVGFVSSFIDDAYTPGGEKLLEPVAELIGEMILSPATKNGRFLGAYVEGEKANLIDAIRGIVNDKRDYADRRLLQEMCGEEPYGVSRFGEEKDVERITPAKLNESYRRLIASSRLELFYIGSASLERVRLALEEAFSTLPREEVGEPAVTTTRPAPEEPRYVAEEMDVTQGKLSMGFRCGSDDTPAMLLANALFGGTSNSKLFLNVREKLSLCYFATSQYHRKKNLVTVSSGIETKNYQKAYDEIMAQLKAVQQGRLEDWELEGARSTMTNAFRTMEDSQGRLEDFYLGQAATGQSETPEDMIAELDGVTLERILAAAAQIRLDTVYFLKGKEQTA
ncbi:insulinase family protein [Oscillibacter hominis]|uniref:Insulinase family protein n=1 Tax=Oscillibacter hominis TaxID=2763056 RepID=A0A7G9B152_9FIRM|nr:pitrilysin family protein [Oscillibacter hominis]QNL43283.1 insulinase family protein [Oscillibacter hominis]